MRENRALSLYSGAVTIPSSPAIVTAISAPSYKPPVIFSAPSHPLRVPSRRARSNALPHLDAHPVHDEDPVWLPSFSSVTTR